MILVGFNEWFKIQTLYRTFDLIFFLCWKCTSTKKWASATARCKDSPVNSDKIQHKVIVLSMLIDPD
jgi:hypothetical protein